LKVARGALGEQRELAVDRGVGVRRARRAWHTINILDEMAIATFPRTRR
jgi:hypothetical protein